MGGLTETDSYGLEAYVCARDRTPLAPIAARSRVPRTPLPVVDDAGHTL